MAEPQMLTELIKNPPAAWVTLIIAIASLIVAVVSVIVAFLSYRHSVASSRSSSQQIQNVANNYQRLTYTIAVYQASQKYNKLLIEVNQEFQPIFNKLSSLAYKAWNDIGEVFDKFGTEYRSPYPRHAFAAYLDAFIYAIREELIHYTGSDFDSIIRRHHRQIFSENVRDYACTYEHKKLKIFITSLLKKRSHRRSPEYIINTSPGIWENLKIIYERIPLNDEPKIFLEMLNCISEYSEVHEQFRYKLDELGQKLENGIEENKNDFFKLIWTENLGQRYYKVKEDINRIKSLYIRDSRAYQEFYRTHGKLFVPDGISRSVYAGGILYIVSAYRSSLS